MIITINRYLGQGFTVDLSRKFLIALVLLISLTFLSPTLLQAQEGMVVHTVAAGENLSSIASRYNVTVSALMAQNNISNANLIRPGQKIVIPIIGQPQPTQTPVPSVEPSRDLPVQPPQPPQPVATPTSPPAGGLEATPTHIPTASVSPLGYTAYGEPVYTVRRGDTLYSISTRFGVTVSSIMQRNNFSSYVIIVSQRVIIPLRNLPTPTRPAVKDLTPVINNNSPAAQPTATPKAIKTSILHLLATAAAAPRIE